MMDFRQLQYFVRVAELGSLSKAAAFLQITQPALSRQIHNLEQQYREALFFRNGRGVTMTEAGDRLLSHARGILRMVERAEEDMENVRTGRAGRVAIGMPATLSATVATPLVRRLRSELPDAYINLIHGRSSQLQEMLLSGTIDMALLLDAPMTPLLEVHEISSKTLVLVGAAELMENAADPIPLADLSKYPLVIPSRPNKVRVVLDTEMAKLGLPMQVVLESDSLETSHNMAREGVGCTVRFDRDDHKWEDGMISRRIVDPAVSMKSQIVLPSRRPISRLQDAAFDIFLEVTREMLA